MSTWVNAPLEGLLTLAPGRPRSGLGAGAFRDALEAHAHDADDAPVAPLTEQTREQIDRFLDELDGDALELSLRLDVLEALARELANGDARLVRGRVAALADLRDALDDVRRRAADARLAHFVASDAPLGAYLKGLHARAAMTARAVERYATSARAGLADGAALERDMADAAAFRFSWLVDSIRRGVGAARMGVGGAGLALRELRAALERLFAATERLDVGFF